MNFTDAVFGPIFDIFGQAATLVPKVGAPSAVTVVDRTRATMADGFMAATPVLHPAVDVRAADLDALAIPVDALRDGSLILGGKTWTIDGVERLPTILGEADGLLRLNLIEAGP